MRLRPARGAREFTPTGVLCSMTMSSMHSISARRHLRTAHRSSAQLNSAYRFLSKNPLLLISPWANGSREPWNKLVSLPPWAIIGATSTRPRKRRRFWPETRPSSRWDTGSTVRPQLLGGAGSRCPVGRWSSRQLISSILLACLSAMSARCLQWSRKHMSKNREATFPKYPRSHYVLTPAPLDQFRPHVSLVGVTAWNYNFTAKAWQATDGEGGILGQSGPTALRTGTYLPAAAKMQFDIADAQASLTSGEWNDIVLHEMMHSIGFGTIWSYLGLV